MAALSLPLLLANLGADYFWLDEGDTAVLASNILKTGLPRAWDGVTFIDSDKGARENERLVMISHPWVQYYLTAGSFALFGQNNFAARFPFAISGWLTIVVVYALVYRITRRRSAGFSSAGLLVFSVQFLLFSRQCRHYALCMLVGSLLLWIFFELRSARSCTLFAVVGILLFHCHPFGIVFTAVVIVTAFLYRPFHAQRRWCLLASPVICAGTLPWIAIAYRGYGENSEVVRSLPQFSGRVIQYLIECASVTPLIAVVIFALICTVRAQFVSKDPEYPSPRSTELFVHRNEFGVLLITFVALAGYGGAMALTQSTDTLWHLGIRFTTILMPLIAMAAAILLIKVAHNRVEIWLPLLFLLSFTKAGQLTPWIFWGRNVTTFDGKEVLEAHLPRDPSERYFNTGEQAAFLRDLTRKNPGTVANICEFLLQHAKPGDLLLTNYDWEPLYFYTHLPQALKIFRDYPIYSAARRAGLPDYVFSTDKVRWLVWRPIWEGYVGYYGDELEKEIVDKGAYVTRVAQFEETIWENRPELHLHRFSGDRYFFTGAEDLPRAEIFRIDWPDSH